MVTSEIVYSDKQDVHITATGSLYTMTSWIPHVSCAWGVSGIAPSMSFGLVLTARECHAIIYGDGVGVNECYNKFWSMSIIRLDKD